MIASSAELHRVAAVDARMVAHDWPFRTRHAEDIARHWAEVTASKPAMFNGQVLLQCRGEIVGERFEARYFQVDYASFITWVRLGHPATDGQIVRNGFALGALRSRDGAYLMGVMAEHTFNAGKIYFAAGTPDPSDITPTGAVDLAGSVLRELEEETGLTRAEVTAADDWTVITSRERVAFLRDVALDLQAEEARALIRDRLSRQDKPELSDIAIARSVADIDPDRMPVFMQVFLRDAFGRS